MAALINLIDSGLAAVPIDRALEPDRLAATSDNEAARERRGEDDDSSVLGEEDPGAALDWVGPRTEGPEACCPWPRDRSA